MGPEMREARSSRESRGWLRAKKKDGKKEEREIAAKDRTGVTVELRKDSRIVEGRINSMATMG